MICQWKGEQESKDMIFLGSKLYPIFTTPNGGNFKKKSRKINTIFIKNFEFSKFVYSGKKNLKKIIEHFLQLFLLRFRKVYLSIGVVCRAIPALLLVKQIWSLAVCLRSFRGIRSRKAENVHLSTLLDPETAQPRHGIETDTRKQHLRGFYCMSSCMVWNISNLKSPFGVTYLDVI